MSNPIVFQGIPKSNTPLINPDGTMNLAWYRFFIAVFNKTGLNTPGITVGFQPAPEGPAVTAIPVSTYGLANNILVIYHQITGEKLGQVTLTP